MRRSRVRLPQAAPLPTPQNTGPPAIPPTPYMWRAIKIHRPYPAADEKPAPRLHGLAVASDARTDPSGHARPSHASKHPLHHLRVSPRTQPDRRRAMPKIVHPCRLGRPIAGASRAAIRRRTVSSSPRAAASRQLNSRTATPQGRARAAQWALTAPTSAPRGAALVRARWFLAESMNCRPVESVSTARRTRTPWRFGHVRSDLANLQPGFNSPPPQPAVGARSIRTTSRSGPVQAAARASTSSSSVSRLPRSRGGSPATRRAHGPSDVAAQVDHLPRHGTAIARMTASARTRAVVGGARPLATRLASHSEASAVVIGVAITHGFQNVGCT